MVFLDVHRRQNCVENTPVPRLFGGNHAAMIPLLGLPLTGPDE